MPTVIRDATAAMVAGFMLENILPHLLRVDTVMFATDQTGHARWIAGHILINKMDRITIRDIMQAYKALSAPEARRTVDVVTASLVSVSWLEPEESAQGHHCLDGQSKRPWRFTQRAEAEAARRAKAKEQIAEARERLRRAKADQPRGDGESR